MTKTWSGGTVYGAQLRPMPRVRQALHGRVRLAGEEGDVRVVPRLAVDVDLLRAHLDRLPLDRDHPLDEVAALAVGRGAGRSQEDDHVARARLPQTREAPEGDVGHRDLQARAVEELVDQQVVADLERRQHRARRDLER